MIHKPATIASPALSRKIFIGLMAGIVLLGTSLGFYLGHSWCPSLSTDTPHTLNKLAAAQQKIESLRNQLSKASGAAGNMPSPLAQHVSDNFQKIFLYFKLEQQVLTGKNFSVTFHRLQELMGRALDDPQFDVLRNNTHGFASPAALESSFRSYKIYSQNSPKDFWYTVESFFGSFLKVRNFREKEKMDSLCALLRSDQNKQALHFIEIHFPEYKEWSQTLKNKIEAKKALAELDNILLASLRIKE